MELASKMHVWKICKYCCENAEQYEFNLKQTKIFMLQQR